eukprot:TRINITY_DN5268_c0_g1_i2.p1 TRINITY_DN5268_c0_g1~~TRINITY_DN5268_c0_g1_i2.p1  ORF type:complete len:155 (-),score=9.02 TRINITY_DN5268_c0_g1_i2:139-603(-)
MHQLYHRRIFKNFDEPPVSLPQAAQQYRGQQNYVAADVPQIPAITTSTTAAAAATTTTSDVERHQQQQPDQLEQPRNPKLQLLPLLLLLLPLLLLLLLPRHPPQLTPHRTSNPYNLEFLKQISYRNLQISRFFPHHRGPAVVALQRTRNYIALI